MNRFGNTKKIGLLGIIANLFLFILKLSFGLISKSQALIADSFNSIGDVFASLMTFIGNKIASGERDEDHNFGHEKAEYIFSMFISISILVVAIKLLYDSFKAILFGNEVIFSMNLIIICLITIFIKLILFIYTKSLYKKENNILIKSNMIDHRNDIFLTIAVLISIIFSKYEIYFVDIIISIIISIWFLLTGINLFKESYNVLMDMSLDLETKNKMINLISKDKRIIKVDDLHSVAIGCKFIVVLTISVNGNLSTFDSHEIANLVENKIIKSFDNVKEVFVHINPI